MGTSVLKCLKGFFSHVQLLPIFPVKYIVPLSVSDDRQKHCGIQYFE